MARVWLTPGQFREVVQIGAVKLDAESFQTVAELDLLVRPRINPHLSDYFEQLTGITTDKVARRGLDFADAYDRLLDFAENGPIAAFGQDDLVLQENLRLYGIKARPLPLFYDLRGWFAVQGVDPRGRLACEIAPALGLDAAGRNHNALDDARSLAAGMAALAARGKFVRPAA